MHYSAATVFSTNLQFSLKVILVSSVCVREREGGRGGGRERERERDAVRSPNFY